MLGDMVHWYGEVGGQVAGLLRVGYKMGMVMMICTIENSNMF